METNLTDQSWCAKCDLTTGYKSYEQKLNGMAIGEHTTISTYCPECGQERRTNVIDYLNTTDDKDRIFAMRNEIDPNNQIWWRIDVGYLWLLRKSCLRLFEEELESSVLNSFTLYNTLKIVYEIGECFELVESDKIKWIRDEIIYPNGCFQKHENERDKNKIREIDDEFLERYWLGLGVNEDKVYTKKELERKRWCMNLSYKRNGLNNNE